MTDKRTDEELVLLCGAKDKDAMEELLRRHAGLVRSCARRYFLVGGETEDLIQEGMMGLYSAINAYDGKKEKGSSFKNFAYLCITRKILDAVKSAYYKKNGSLYAEQLDEGLVETGLSPEELLILSDEEKELRQKMSKELSDFEFKVMTMYVDGLTSAEICESTGKSLKSVGNAIQRSKKKLLEVLKK